MGAPVVSEARVPVAAFQQVPGQDLTAMGTLPQGSIDNVVENILIAGVGYAGMGVSQVGTSNILTVDPGYLIKGGPAYSLRDTFQVDLTPAINAVPDSANYIAVAIVADGQEFQTQETRTFVDASKLPTNPTTPAPTLTQATPTRVVRAVVISSPKGVADVQPNLPSFSSTLCLLATVIVSNTGIQSVAQNTATQITRLDQIVAIVEVLQVQAASDKATIAALQGALSTLASTEQSRYDALQAEITALTKLINAIDARQTTQAAGAVFTQVDYLSDLSFQPATTSTPGFAPLQPYASNLMIVNNKLTPPYQLVDNFAKAVVLPSSPYYKQIALNSFGTLSAQPMQKGFGIQRTRYGLPFQAQNAYQLLATGDPSQIFTGGALTYDPSWDFWTKANPELSHQNGFYKDLTGRDLWTPRMALAPIVNMPAVAMRFNPGCSMIGEIALAITKGTRGDIRVLLCDDANGAPDFSSVLTDVTVSYANLYTYIPSYGGPTGSPGGVLKTGLGCDAFLPSLVSTPIPNGKIYWLVVVSDGDHKIAVSTQPAGGGNVAQGSLGNTILATPDIKGNFAFYSAASSLSMQFLAPVSNDNWTAIPLKYINQNGGIDTLDFILSCDIPPGADIRLGLYQPDGTMADFGPIAAAGSAGGPNLLAGSPSTVAPYLIFSGNGQVFPIIDLAASVTGQSAVTAGKQSSSFDRESSVRAPTSGGPFSTITESVIIKGFDPTHHTFTDVLEVGTGYATKPAATSVSGPTLQADGTTLITTTWTLGTPVTSWKMRRQGTTDSVAVQFTPTQATNTAK